VDDWLTPDDGLGGEQVAGRVKGLSLISSRLDAATEPAAALSYTEWTLEFRNMSTQAREARAQIALPPGGVVSRLTLWVNGEEREAAFGGRSQVRSAYREVAVVRRRDPLLVTTCGPDRILAQCFPVPANGGTMKVRIGVTAPLTDLNAKSGQFCWPKIIERNFSVPSDFKHSLWIESPTKMTAKSGPLKVDQPREKAFALHGSLDETGLEEADSVEVERPAGVVTTWTKSLESNSVIVQTLVPANCVAPTRVVIVVDGSIGVKRQAEQLAQAMDKIPERVLVKVVVAGDKVVPLNDEWQKGTQELRSRLKRKLEAYSFQGGCDNVPALEAAWDAAFAAGGGVVLWVHAAQPYLLSNADGLRQRMERSGGSTRLICLQAGPGPDRIAEQLDGLPDVSVLPATGGLRPALEQLFMGWAGTRESLEAVRERVPQTAENTNGVAVSRHIERLWARDEVNRLLRGRQNAGASQLAAAQQLVTPASGAVVLETARQFAENGLTPADPAAVPTVPIIPEPSPWALLLLAGVFVLAGKFQRKRA
jgi:hypothetical protein